MSKHSPGPWRWDEGGIAYGTVLRDANDGEVLQGYDDGNDGRYVRGKVDVSEADARLIAAAPELLALVRRMADPLGICDEDRDAARDLIARIGGGE